MISPWLGMAVVVGSLGLLMAVLRLWQRLGTPHPQVIPQGLPMGLGLLTPSFSWPVDVPLALGVLRRPRPGRVAALLLFSEKTSRLETLLIGLLLAWVTMMFEAIAWGGLDNLALPLVSYLLLRAYLELSVDRLLLRLAVTAGLTAFALLYYRRSTL